MSGRLLIDSLADWCMDTRRSGLLVRLSGRAGFRAGPEFKDSVAKRSPKSEEQDRKGKKQEPPSSRS